MDTIYDYSQLNSLSNLKILSVQDNKTNTIDLSKFSKLKICNITFSKRLIGLDICTSLEDLSINNYKRDDFHFLKDLKNIQKLSLYKPNITSLSGVENIKHLKTLNIYNASKLIDIKDISRLSQVKEVEFEKCINIKNYTSFGSLKSLKKIILAKCGTISSLSFLESLQKLEFISFVNTEIIDGDLTYCKGIKYVGFNDKPHYTNKFKEFNNYEK